jgi:alpha-L-fucosidase 2
MTELWFSGDSTGWLDDLPLGNGRLGAMVGAAGARTTLQVNDGTFWTGGVAADPAAPGPDPTATAPAESGTGQPAAPGQVVATIAPGTGRLSAADAAAALAEARALIEADRFTDAEQALAGFGTTDSAAYLPFVTVHLDLPPGHTVLERRLNLDDAVHRVRGRIAGTPSPVGPTDPHDDPSTAAPTELVQTTFVSAPAGVLVHRLEFGTGTGAVGISLSTRLIDLGRRRDPTVEPADAADFANTIDPAEAEPSRPATLVIDVEAPARPGTVPTPGITPLRGSAVLSVMHNGRLDPDAPAHELRILDASVITLVLATATTFVAAGRPAEGTLADTARRALAAGTAAAARPTAELTAEHRTDHGALFGRCTLTLAGGDARVADPADLRLQTAVASPLPVAQADPGLVALLFDYGRYLLIASSRPGGLPATLQGLWNDSPNPPWGSNYTLNVNTEMNYWAAEPVQLRECADPLLDFVEALAGTGAQTAARLYGCRGWVAHHNSDAWACGTPSTGDASWALWPMAGPWLVRLLDERRRFGAATAADTDRLWRLAAGSARFCLDYLVEGPAGRLHTRPSTSPENQFLTPAGPAAVADSSAMDRTLIRELFALLEPLGRAAGHADHPIIAEARAARDRIASHRTGESGRLLEWDTDRPEQDRQHRHVSHLAGLYPGDGMSAADRAAASRSLDARGDDSTGWSLVWKMALRARLGQAGKVDDLLELVLRPARDDAGPHEGGLYRNFFAAHPPFQIDGNLGFVAALTECLVQSHTSVIDLLPALPRGLETGRVSGLGVRGGLLVDLDWAAGALLSAVFTTRPGAPAGSHRVRTPRPGQAPRIDTIQVGPGRSATLSWPAR